MRRLICFLFLAVLTVGPASAGTASRPAGIPWRAWDAGLKEASTSGRPVLVDVYTEWCGWCKRMDRDVYSRTDVSSYLSKHFVSVKLDAESNRAAAYDRRAYTQESLANRFRVSSYPTTIFLKSNGQHLVNVPGYVPADRFLLLLRYVGDGHLERQETFEDFVKNETGSSEGGK